MQVLLQALEQHLQRPSGITTSQYEVGPRWGIGCWSEAGHEVGKAFCVKLRGTKGGRCLGSPAVL